jgi:hypothetical protein
LNNVETSVRISRAGWARLNAAANSRQQGRQAVFRDKAWRLTRCTEPRFDISGQPLDCPLAVGLHPDLMAALHTLCDKLGVPHECAGELVTCWAGE